MMRIAFLIIILSIFTNCSGKKSSSGGSEVKPSLLKLSPQAIKTGGFAVFTAKPGIIKRTVQLQGNIKANEDNVTSIVSHVSGIALKIHKQLGAKVKKGQPLVELNSKEMGQAQLDYISFYNKMSFSWNRLKIEKGIYDKRISSKLAYLKAKEGFDRTVMTRDLAAQKLRLLGVSAKDIKRLPRRAKSKLTIYILRAPVDGVIIKKSIARGEMAKSDSTIYTIANLSSVWLDIKVPVQYLSAIKANDKVDVYSGKLQKNIKGKVIYISPTADAQTRSALVRLSLPNKKGLWRPGLCAMGEFVVKEKKAAVVIPDTAILQIGGKPSIFVEVSPGVYKMKTILIGERDSRSVELRGGIKAGEKVVIENVIALKGEWLATVGE
jgi:membrane fusion protein, heavy metal efflux system